MRLIDADALLTHLNHLQAENGTTTYRKALNDALHDFFPQIISDAPTIDPESLRPHGRWVPDKDTHKCSKCGFGMFLNIGYYFLDDKCIFSGGETFVHNFCPNCGAKMDLEENK